MHRDAVLILFRIQAQLSAVSIAVMALGPFQEFREVVTVLQELQKLLAETRHKVVAMVDGESAPDTTVQ